MNIFNLLYEQILNESLWDNTHIHNADAAPFKASMFRMYELEYKLRALNDSPVLSTNPKRIENIKNGIIKELEKNCIYLRKVLLKTFANWLKKHALLKPKIWATERYNDFREEDEKSQLDYLAYEYFRYANSKQYTSDEHLVFSIFFNGIDKNINKLPRLKEILNRNIKEYLQDQYDNEPEEMMQQWNVTTEEDAQKYIENAEISDYGIEGVGYDKESFLYILDRHLSYNGFEHIIIELYENLVFPMWFKHWSERGIVETRANIENAYKNLKNANIKDLGNFIAQLSIALNATHQSGSMLDYVENDINEDRLDTAEHQYYTRELLDALSGEDFHQTWNDDIKESGV
jgi:hypothetical protein